MGNFRGFDAINTQRVQTHMNRQRMYSDLIKSDHDLLEKSGEGSRGGKVIGHTQSGKPIYDKFNHTAHKDFTTEDHEDAAKAHVDIAKDDVLHSMDHAKSHTQAAEEKYKEHVKKRFGNAMKESGYSAYVVRHKGQHNHFFAKNGTEKIGEHGSHVSDADKPYAGKIVSQVKPD